MSSKKTNEGDAPFVRPAVRRIPIPSSPIPVPMLDPAAGVGIIYDIGRVFELPEVYDDLTAPQQARHRALMTRAVELDALEEGDAKEQANKDWLREMRANNRAVTLRVIGWIVLRVEWALDGPPPIPDDPASWDGFYNEALEWLVGPEAQGQARAELQSPKLGILSTMPDTSDSSVPPSPPTSDSG